MRKPAPQLAGTMDTPKRTPSIKRTWGGCRSSIGEECRPQSTGFANPSDATAWCRIRTGTNQFLFNSPNAARPLAIRPWLHAKMPALLSVTFGGCRVLPILTVFSSPLRCRVERNQKAKAVRSCLQVQLRGGSGEGTASLMSVMANEIASRSVSTLRQPASAGDVQRFCGSSKNPSKSKDRADELSPGVSAS